MKSLKDSRIVAEKKQIEEMEAPIQMRIIDFFGLKSYLLQHYIFKRQASKYKMKLKDGKPVLFLPHQFSTHFKLNAIIKIIQTSVHSIPLVYFKHIHSKDDFIIVYSHGNAGDLSTSLNFVQNIALTYEIDVLIYDYTTYGESRGQKINEQIIVRDLQIIINWLERPINKIILWGFSLGSYPTVYNAAVYNVGAVILLEPLASVNCFFDSKVHTNSRFKKDFLSNLDEFDKITSKILLIHSTGDEIISVNHSRMLYDRYVASNDRQKINYLEVQKFRHHELHPYFNSQSNNILKYQMKQFLKEVRSNTKPVKDCHIRRKNRSSLVEAEFEDEKFSTDKSQELLIHSGDFQKSPGRRFLVSNSESSFDLCCCGKADIYLKQYEFN